jgi:hypothetical protein
VTEPKPSNIYGFLAFRANIAASLIAALLTCVA